MATRDLNHKSDATPYFFLQKGLHRMAATLCGAGRSRLEPDAAPLRGAPMALAGASPTPPSSLLDA
jgi:hypothetical protein